MDAITLFKQAAAQLQHEEVYLQYAAARKANDEDAELQSKIGDFNLLRLELNRISADESADENKKNEVNQKLSDTYTQIMNSEPMLQYNEAKHDLDTMLEYINSIISAACNGEDPMTVEESHGCTGNCSSCGGCHE